MDQINKDTNEIDLSKIIYALLHYVWFILIIGLLGAAVMWFVSGYVLKPVYISSAKVYVINRQDGNKITYSDLQTGTQLTKDYLILVKSRPVTERVIKKLNLPLAHEDLSQLIEVNIPQDTRILEISVKNENPALAKSIADTIAEVSAEQMVSVMETEKANIMEQGNLPDQPSGPHTISNTILGTLAGILLASLVVAAGTYFNDRISTSEDIEKYLSLTILGSIPLEEEDRRKHGWIRKGFRRNKWSRKNTALQV